MSGYDRIDVALIGLIVALSVFSAVAITVGYAEISESTDIEEDCLSDIPYIIDEEGRLRIVATATIYLNINVGLSDNNDSTED